MTNIDNINHYAKSVGKPLVWSPNDIYAVLKVQCGGDHSKRLFQDISDAVKRCSAGDSRRYLEPAYEAYDRQKDTFGSWSDGKTSVLIPCRTERDYNRLYTAMEFIGRAYPKREMEMKKL